MVKQFTATDSCMRTFSRRQNRSKAPHPPALPPANFLRPAAASRPAPRAAGLLLAALGAACCVSSVPLSGQTLARPGWAGSGLTAEPWWHSAVFYRIDPLGFQDSDTDGRGDLPGVVQRLDYLQALGIDAIILQSPFDPAGFDDLLAEASRRHIRVVVQLARGAGGEPPQKAAALQISEARAWLARGAAGIESLDGLAVDRAVAASSGQPPFLLDSLRHLADGFPGQRILLVGPGAAPISLRKPAEGQISELMDVVLRAGGDSSSFEAALADSQSTPAGAPLLQSEGNAVPSSSEAAEALGMRKIVAATLLASGDAVALTYGQELGLDRSRIPVPSGTAVSAVPVTMQWTPNNVTPPPPVESGSKTPAIVYGAYQAYIPPPPTPLLGKAPRLPEVAISDTIAAAPVDPNSLAGFTAGTLPPGGKAPNGRLANVAVESGDPDSLLNFDRHLVALHHGNATLRSGSLTVLEFADRNALVWVRRAPAGARTVASVVVACNLSDRPLTLFLDRDLERAHIRPGALRPLLASDLADKRMQNTGRMTLAPWSVYIGEIFHH